MTNLTYKQMMFTAGLTASLVEHTPLPMIAMFIVVVVVSLIDHAIDWFFDRDSPSKEDNAIGMLTEIQYNMHQRLIILEAQVNAVSSVSTESEA